MSSRKVALVLSSGGPRGFAYIGAIEELLSRGYEISSIAGTSAGSLVGGVYAAGGLDAFKEWLYALDTAKVVSLMDFSISRSHLMKGNKVIEAIRKRVPDVRIEDLPIPFTAVATDLFTGEEVLLQEGPVFDAIRASISIPSMFQPARWRGRTLVDGGIVNTFPLNRVTRTPGDILVGFDVNRIDAAGIRSYLQSREAMQEDETLIRDEARALWKDTLAVRDGAVLQRLRNSLERGGELLKEGIAAGRRTRRLTAESEATGIPARADDNYFSILDRSFGIMNQTIAALQAQLVPPDILVSMPYDSYQGVYGYSHAEEIASVGRTLMARALDAYESAHPGV